MRTDLVVRDACLRQEGLHRHCCAPINRCSVFQLERQAVYDIFLEKCGRFQDPDCIFILPSLSWKTGRERSLSNSEVNFE